MRCVLTIGVLLVVAVGCYGACPKFWKAHDNDCYLFKFYDKVNWARAEQQCKAGGAHLVSIHSQAEQAWITKILKAFGATNEWVWIGLKNQTSDESDASADEEWAWSDDSDLDYTNWNGGSSQSYDGSGGGCAISFPGSNPPGLWWNGPCKILMGYVCKKPQ